MEEKERAQEAEAGMGPAEESTSPRAKGRAVKRDIAAMIQSAEGKMGRKKEGMTGEMTKEMTGEMTGEMIEDKSANQ